MLTKLLVWTVTAVSVLVATPQSAAASTIPLRTVSSFDPSSNEFTEGLAIDTEGTAYVGMALTGEIRGITQNGSQFTLARLDVGDGFLLGLTTDPAGNVYAALPSFRPDTHGVWKITPDGTASRLASLDTDTLPNGLTFDSLGNLYVSDSSLGAVWRVPANRGSAELWVQDPLLAGDPANGIGFGANGVALRKSSVFVANTDRSTVTRIPVEPDGSAGAPSLYVEDPQLHGADGIAWDVKGNLYVATDGLGNSLARVDADLSVTTLAGDDDGLDYPTSVAFGTRGPDRKTLFIANGGLNFGMPGLLAAEIGIPGADQ